MVLLKQWNSKSVDAELVFEIYFESESITRFFVWIRMQLDYAVVSRGGEKQGAYILRSVSALVRSTDKSDGVNKA